MKYSLSRPTESARTADTDLMALASSVPTELCSTSTSSDVRPGTRSTVPRLHRSTLSTLILFSILSCPNPNLTTYKTHLPFIWAWTVWRQNFEIYNLVHIICQVTLAINNLIQYISISLKGKINISDSKVAFTTQLIKIRNC